MTKEAFLQLMLDKGRITQDQHDAAITKNASKGAAAAKYRADKTKLTKAELQEVIDTLLA